MANEKRLIYADDVLAKQSSVGICDAAGNQYGCADVVFVEDIIHTPTVDAVEVVHGHKVVRERHRGVARYIPCPCCGSAVPGNKPYTEKIEYCSVCGKKLDGTFQNYCPNCGAKMDGDGNG